MSCCGGNGRKTSPTVMPARASGSSLRTVAPSLPGVAVFRYEGTTALTVIGRATNRRYYFAKPGAQVAVDLRDQPSVVQVPNVKEIRRS